MLTHILDTSAWIALIRGEPGAEMVYSVLAKTDNEVGISVLSLVELHARLHSFDQAGAFEEIVEDYRPLFAGIVPVDESVALRAIDLRTIASARVPAIDALIAATAAAYDAFLIHRDPHFSAIPDEQVRQVVLVGPE